MSKTLQGILTEVQERIAYYHTLPKRKQLKRKYWDAYAWLVRCEKPLQDAIKEGEDLKNKNS